MPPGTYGAKAVATGGAIVVPQQFVADPVALGQPPTSLLSVLPVIVQPSPQFAYLRQSVRTNNAAVVAEGAVKPTSVYTVVRIEDQLDVVAHLSEPLPRMWVADSPAIASFLGSELSHGLALAVEAMALADIAGTSGIQTNSYSTSILQTLRKSVDKTRSERLSAWCVHTAPQRLGGNRTRAAVNIGGGVPGPAPWTPVVRTLWGLAVTVTTSADQPAFRTLSRKAQSGLNTDSQECADRLVGNEQCR